VCYSFLREAIKCKKTKKNPLVIYNKQFRSISKNSSVGNFLTLTALFEIIFFLKTSSLNKFKDNICLFR